MMPFFAVDDENFRPGGDIFTSGILRASRDPDWGARSGFWPEGRPFAACLTHDVDHVSYLSFAESLRRMRDVYSPGSARDKLHRLKKNAVRAASALASVLSRRQDPFWNFEKWLEVESRYGAKSTFFFFADEPSRYHVKDCRYRFQDRVIFEGRKMPVAALMAELDRRGWEIGLHSSYHSFDDASELLRQRCQIESAIGRDVVSNRQHTLRFDMLLSPEAARAAGFLFDSTPGLNKTVGFRFGTSWPFPYAGKGNSDDKRLLHVPLHVQDSALFASRNLGLGPDDALRCCQKIIDEACRAGGVVTLSWHHGRADENLFPGWFGVYEKCLEYLRDKGAWLATVRDIGEWWEAGRKTGRFPAGTR